MSETFYFGKNWKLEVSKQGFSLWERKGKTWKWLIDGSLDYPNGDLSIRIHFIGLSARRHR